MVEVEPLVLATAAVAGADERLTICTISWLACFHSFVDGRRLSELTRDSAATVRSYLGIMLSLAIEAPDGAGRAPQYEPPLWRTANRYAGHGRCTTILRHSPPFAIGRERTVSRCTDVGAFGTTM